MTLDELKNDVEQEIKDRFEELNEAQYSDDLLFKLVDGWIPLDNKELIECLASDMSLAYIVDEGLCTPGANIFERIQTAIEEQLLIVAYDKFEELDGEL